MGDKISDKYLEVKAEVDDRIKDLKAAGKKIDWDIYKNMVNEVLNEFKDDGKVTAEVAKRMGTQLGRDWDMVKAELK
jgi:hypothetical protein